MIGENERWLLSFYRTSEISGALFFGRVARGLRPGPVQRDLTKHFADEAAHAWRWTDCLERLGAPPLKLGEAYQDKYLAAAGMPANLMEILAITQVFERRVIGQYALHGRVPDLHPEITRTLAAIMEDEKWHLQWIGDALKALEQDYGAEEIRATIERCTAADREVYRQTLVEHEERVEALLRVKRGG